MADQEDLLAAAGLTARPANTPRRTASLHTLPSNKFISKSKGDRTEYIHVDPIVCNCLYEGDQTTFNAYKKGAVNPSLGPVPPVTTRLSQGL